VSHTDSSLYRWTDPAREAYNKAIESLSKELTPDECQAIWLHSRTSMGDVQDAVVEAQKEYKSRSKDSKIRKWLNNASSRVMYYGGMLKDPTMPSSSDMDR